MDLKKLFRIYEEDPQKYGLYSLSIRFYNDSEEGVSASVFVNVQLDHCYDNDPDGIRHRDFFELLSTLQDCIGFNFLRGNTSSNGILMIGWL